MPDIIFLDETSVLEISLEITGDSENLVKPLGLQSAVARQWAGSGDFDLYPDVPSKAGALMHGLIQNHCFVDGNKRIGLTTAGVFCDINGHLLSGTEDDQVELALDIAGSSSLTVEQAIDRLRPIIQTL